MGKILLIYARTYKKHDMFSMAKYFKTIKNSNYARFEVGAVFL